jgi:hypothetical protein
LPKIEGGFAGLIGLVGGENAVFDSPMLSFMAATAF